MKRQLVLCVFISAALALLPVGQGGSAALASPTCDPTASLQAGEWRNGGPFDGDGNPVRINAIAASPFYAEDGTLFAAGNEQQRSGSLYRTMDRGQSWTEVLYPVPPNPYSGGWFEQVAVAVSDSAPANTVFASYNGRLSPSAQVADASLAPYGFLYRSIDRGQSWENVLNRAMVGPFALSPAFDSDHTLFAIANGQLERSTNAGVTWQQLPFPTGAHNLAVFHLALSPNYPIDHTLYAAGTGNIHRSTDAGLTWEPLLGLTPTNALVLSPNFTSDGTFWTTYRTTVDATPPSGVLRHTNRGANWQLASAGLPGWVDPYPRHLAVSPRYAVDRSLFTALSGPVAGWMHHSLFRTANGGDSWIDLGAAPGDPDVLGLAATRTKAEGLVAHLATERGVWHYGGLCEERLVNGGFETNSAWTFPDTPRPAGYSTEKVHSGQRSARAGIVNGTDIYSYSTFQQIVTIPAGATQAFLRLWWYPLSNEGAGSPAVASPTALQALAEGRLAQTELQDDAQFILLLDEHNQIVRTLLWTRSDARAWQQLSFNLSAYAGRTLKIHLGVINNGNGRTTALFADDASLTICWLGQPPVRSYLPMIWTD